MSNLLECCGLTFGYKAAFAAPLDFGLSSGEVVALMGENGSGKSTLLKTFSGRISPLSGKVNLSLVCLKNIPARERARRIALVRMNGFTPSRMTVREFVGLGRTPYAGILDGRTREDEKMIDEAIDLLDLDSFKDREVEELSDGERSRVYLAQAVAQQVEVLLLDEPNAFLDIPRSHRLFQLLKQLASERNMGIIVSTHSVEYAVKYCDRIMVIHDGNVGVEKACDAYTKGLLDWTK